MTQPDETEQVAPSLHETVCSDARKLAHEIHSDVFADEAEIAAAIEAGFRYREQRLEEESVKQSGIIVRMQAERAEMLVALKATVGYMRNAKIDLETGAPKKTAVQTINGGLKMAEAAVALAEDRQP